MIKYLVPDGKHLPVTGEDGRPDHHLMGAAWAALHGGYRGNKYEGPDKEKAIAELTRMYKSEGMTLPNEKPQLMFANVSAAIDDQGWVQLAPYGDFANVDSSGRRVIQRFTKQDAETIVNEFNSLLNVPQRLLGLPWYLGHPDHPRFRATHTDSKAYGRIKKLEARDDGLYGNVKFGAAGKALLDDEAFHGHSVNWKAMPNGKENGIQIFHPVSLKSVGFTNDPAIPVRPASLANEDELSDLAAAAGFDTPMPGYAVGTNPQENDDMTIPPKLKLLAGFKADDDVTIEQVLAAIEKKIQPNAPSQQQSMQANQQPVELVIGDDKFSITFANEESAKLPERITKLGADKTKAEQDLANEKKARAEERKRAATIVVDGLVKEGKVVTADRETKITELCNAEDFDAKAKELANVKPVVKTAARSTGLAGKHVQLSADMQDRSSKFQQLVNERAQKFPNESYDDRWNAVASTTEGKELLAQMKRPNEENE